MNPKVVLPIKVALGAVYGVIAFCGLFVVLFQDDPALSHSFWAKFIAPLWLIFIVAAIWSWFLPIRISWLPPLVVFLVSLLVLHLCGSEVAGIKKRAALERYAEERQKAVHDFTAPDGSFLSFSASSDYLNLREYSPISQEKSAQLAYIGASPDGRTVLVSWNDSPLIKQRASYMDYRDPAGKNVFDRLPIVMQDEFRSEIARLIPDLSRDFSVASQFLTLPNQGPWKGHILYVNTPSQDMMDYGYLSGKNVAGKPILLLYDRLYNDSTKKQFSRYYKNKTGQSLSDVYEIQAQDFLRGSK